MPRFAPVRGALARLRTLWSSSIQIRVVASTVALSIVVIGVVGWFLLQQTRDALVDDRVTTVRREAANETRDARERLSGVVGSEDNVSRQLSQLVEPIIERGRSRDFSVVLAGPSGAGSSGDGSSGLGDGIGVRYTSGLELSSVPDRLVEHFDESAQTAWTFSDIRYTDESSQEDGPGIVVGSRLQLPADQGAYTLYFVFPMERETSTLDLVTSAMLAAGTLLMILIAGLAWVVTRQVLTPIRMARRVAERLAAGELQERMRVRGEDDIARLGTSFNQMASNLQGQIRQLEELSRVQRRFTSDVSHELRTPLTTVRMAGDVLHDARADFDPSTARAAELLQTELDRFEGLLADLLEISRFDAGAVALEIEDVDLVEIAHRVKDVTRALAEQRGTTVVVEARAQRCIAGADPRRIERIVRNLVTNAIDHAGTDRGRERVEILVDVDETAAAIAVRDHGVGLQPGEAAMVFNRFWRGDPARARTTGGTGLGLAISLEDAHLHGGWLQAWGQPGQGAQFRLTLPRHAGGPLRQSPVPLVPVDREGVPR